MNNMNNNLMMPNPITFNQFNNIGLNNNNMIPPNQMMMPPMIPIMPPLKRMDSNDINLNNFSFNPISMMGNLNPNQPSNNNNNNNNNPPNNNNTEAQQNNQENKNNENKKEEKDKEKDKEKEKEEMINALNQEKNNLLMNMNNLINNMNKMNNSMNTLSNIHFMYNNDLNNKNKEKLLFFDNFDENYTLEQDKEIMDDFLTENKIEGKDDLDNKKKEKMKSSEKYRGTFINVIHTLSSNTLQNTVEAFCYDEINSCFYLLGVSVLSIAIFVCDTFEKQFEKEFSIIEKNLNIKLNDILNQKAENILENYIDKILLLLNCFKMDLPWRYSNWNFFYSSLALNNLNKDEKAKYGFGEYPHRLFHSKKGNDFGGAEVFNEKIKSTTEKNQNYIFDKIKQISENKLELIDSNETNKFDSPPPSSDNYKKDRYYNNKLTVPSNSAFNWTCKNFISYKAIYMNNNPDEEKDILNDIKSKNELCLYNTRYFYGQNNYDDFVESYKLILDERKNNITLFLLKLKYLLRDCQYYYTLEKKEIKNILEEVNNLINELLIENKNNKEILDMIFDIIEENLELIFDTEKKREKLFMTLKSINQDLFYINLTSLENIISFKLKNSFYRINNYKSLYLTRDLLSKPLLLENVANKKIISPLGSSLNNSFDMGSNYDENYSDEDKFYKEMTNEKNSINSDEENKTEKEMKEIKEIKENKRIMIQGNFSEINKKKYFGFNLFDNSEDDMNKIFSIIKSEISEKNNKNYFYYFIEGCLHSLFLPNVNIQTTQLILDNIYSLIKEFLNKENNDEEHTQNILNLCHIYFLSSNFLKNKLNLNELSKFINNYIEIFELLCQRLNKNIPDFISNAELLGLTPESKKVYEYSLNTNDLNFNHEINFSSNDLIAVEIELINRNPEDLYPSNRDILLYTNYNSKISTSKRNTTKNNYKDFGTCFLHKISGESLTEKKIYFLFGNVLCISTVASSLGSGGGVPSLIDIKFMASQIPEFKGKEFNIVTKTLNEKNEVNHKIKIPLKALDTKLRITCYPFKGGNFYGKGRFAIDNAKIEKQLNCLDEVNYVINNCYKMLINLENKNQNSAIEKYKNIFKFKKDNKALKYYKNIIEKNNIDNLVLLNQNKKYYIYDNETNPILNILKYIQNKDHYKVVELNDELKNINIPNLRGIDKLSQFNLSLWNIIKNGLYLYTNKDTEFISQFLNQLAMNIKRKKGTYDMIKNLTYDIVDMLDKKEKQEDKEKKVDLKKNIEDHILNEIKSMYFNNEAALDEICQVNNIQYEKLSNDVKLKNLNTFFLNELNLLTKYSKYQEYDPEEKKEIENKLVLEKSPFVKPLVNIIQKIVILDIFEIGYQPSEKNLLKEFLFDQELNLDNLVNDILNKYKNISIKLYGFDLYYNYATKIKENKNFIYKFLLNDYSLLSINFIWDLDIEIIKEIINKEKINEIIENKMQLLLDVLTKDLSKKNITFQIGKLILIINDIIKLFPILEDKIKNDISKKSIEILKIIFNDHKKLFGENNFKEFIELFNKLLINLTQDIPSIISEVIEIFINEIKILFQNADNAKALNRDEEIEKKKNISLVLGYIIKFLQNINLKSNEKNTNDSILKLLDVIFSVITSSNKKDILNFLTSIVKTIMSNIGENDFQPDFSKIYTKLGHLYFLAENNSLNNFPQKSSNKKFKLIFNAANSELDYGILVNVLYYFEEKYPTVLSRYRLDKKFEKNLEKMTLEEIKKFNIIEMESLSVYNPPNLLVTLDPKVQKIEEEKIAKIGVKEIQPFTSYHALLKNATSHTVNPGIARLRNKKVKTWKMADKINKYLVDLYTKLNEQIVKNQKEKKNNTKKILEIKLDIMHIKRIQQHIKVAEKLGELACLRGNSVLSNKYTYEQVLYFSNLLHQCLNFKIKSPPMGLNNSNNLFAYEDIFLPLPKPEELIDGYTNVIKETSVNFANVTIIKDSLYEKLIDIKKESINIINNTKKEYILDEQIMSTINQLTQIIYYYLNINENFYKKIIEELSNEMNQETDKINLEKILGILYLISGEYHLLKAGQKIIYNGKKAIISNIFLNKYNQCEIQLVKENEENKNIEVISQKMKVNCSEIITQNIYTKKLIQELNLNDLINYFLKINESKNKSDLLLNIILKILYQSNKEKLYSIKEELRQKLVEIITPKSCFIQSSTISELELSYSQSLFSKFENNYKRLYQDIFIPRYNTYIPTSASIPSAPLRKIQNQVLPESDFISCLPQVSLNKGLSCLQNAIIFDKIFVDLIINAYRHDKYKNAVAMSTSQIRSHLLNGNLKSAYDDLAIVFENAPVNKGIFDDNYNPNRVFIEKCTAGKIFLCHDKKLKKEKLVIILFSDFINRICLVMTPGSEVKVFWTSYENLDMINTNYSPLCYLTNDLDKKFKQDLDKLNAAYANKILVRLNQCGNLDENKDMSMAKLIDWNEYCKDNIIYSEIENNSGTNIGNLLNNTSNNALNNINENLLKNIELQKIILNQWKKLHDDIKIYNINLFQNIKLNNGSLLPLRKLCMNKNENNEDNISTNNKYNQIIISFDSNAYLGPQATLRFYSDEEGKNLLYEIQSIKKEKRGLQSILINNPEVYVEYIPGTTVFYLGEWHLHSRDSDLPCIVAFIPNNFECLMNMTNNLTNIVMNNQNMLKELITCIASNCINDNFPILLQMNLFKLLNNIFNNLGNYLNNDSNKYKEIFENCATIEQKLNAIGLNKNIFDKFNQIFTEKMDSHDKDIFFASPYIIELSNCILNVISLINEPIENTKTILVEELKLFNLLKKIKENKPIDDGIHKDIVDKLKNYANQQFKKILLIENKKLVQKNVVAERLEEWGGVVHDPDSDIISIEGDKVFGIIIDQFNTVKLIRCLKPEKKEEEKKEEPPEEQMWECAACHQLNDKDNESCVFCDGPKVIAPPKKEVKKKVAKNVEENKNNINNYQIDECMDILKQKIGNDFYVINENDEKFKLIYNKLMNQLITEHFKNIKDFEEKKSKIESYYKYTVKDEEKLNQILSILNLIKEGKEITLEEVNKLFSFNIDIYLDIFTSDNSQISLDRINDLGKIIFSLQKLPNSTSIYNLIQTPSIFRSKEILRQNNSLFDMSIGELRYYLNIISIINDSFTLSMSLLRPPELKKLSNKKEDKNDEYSSLSTLMTQFRYIISPKIKNEILHNIIELTEYDEELIQIPSFNVERLNEDKNNDKINNSEQMFKKFIIRPPRKQGGELIFQKINTAPEMIFKNMTEFNQVYEQYLQVDPACFRVKRFDLVHVAFKIKYMNEFVQGLSGPYRQFFSDIANELENSDKINLLCPTQNNLNKKGEYKDKYTINPKSEEFSQFEFLGILMGLCIRTGVYLPVNLCSLVWKKIIGEKIDKNDILIFDEGLSKMGEILFKKDNEINKDLLKNSFGENISTISLTDSTQKKLSKTYTTEELISSKKERIDLFKEIHNLRLNESNSQITSIIKGINKIIPISVLQYFTWEEMERLVCGKKTVDIELLEKNTVIAPELEKKDYLVKWVWEIVKEFTEEERIQFVKFCYAQERLPYTQEEYDQKQIQFSIKFNANFEKNGLPRADTCFFFLILPDYTSKEIMKKMISIAIKMDNVGMNGDKENNENRRPDRRISTFSRFDDDNYFDDL